jgi:hypothetical protein
MSISLDDFKYRDSATLEIVPPGGGTEPIGAIEFAGPAHPATRALVERGRKISLASMRGLPQRSLEALELENAQAIAARIIGWNGIKRRNDAGEVVDTPFSPEAAVEMLANPALGWLFSLCVEFLADDRNFLPAAKARQ